MSAQGAKKKRIGSRRQVVNQNKTAKADEFHIMDSASLEQHSTPEGNTKSLNVSAHPDNSQSETQNPPSPELTEHRRKLGSSRRNRKGQYVKNSATESYHEPKEDVDPITLDCSFEIQNPTTTNCPEANLESLIPKSRNLQVEPDENSTDYKVVETMLGGTDKSDTPQNEELAENVHLVGTQLNSLSVLSCPTVDQQLIYQSNFTEVPEELPEVYSVTEKESKERDKRNEMLRQDGSLQSNYLLSESHEKSEVIKFSNIPEITTDRNSPREITEIEYSVEQAIFPSPNEELPKDEEQNEHCSFQVKGAQHLEDSINKVHEQEVKPKEMHEIDHSSESVTHDVTENSEKTSGNLIDQTEVSDTYQSALIERSTEDPATKQDDSNPEDKQDVHPTNVNSFEALDHTNENNYIYDTIKLQISGIENEDTAPDQVHEGRVEDDLKPSAQQTVHQEKEGLFSEMEESDSSSQTLQSEIQARLDSQPQLNDTGFYPTGNRRKLGSSRKTKRRQHAEDSVTESNQRSTEEVVGNTSDNEPLETKMSLTIETAVQEESIETMLEGMDTLDTAQTEDVSDQVEENAHAGTLVDISEFTTSSLYSSSTADQQLIDQSNSTEMPEEELPHGYSVTEKESKERDKDTELLRLDGSVQDNYLVKESHLKSEDTESSITLEIETEKHSFREHTEPECSAEPATVPSTKEELPTSEEQDEIFNFPEFKDAHHKEDAVKSVHEHEVNTTQMHEIHHSSESVTHDVTENSEIASGNLIDKTEVSDTYQSVFIEKSTEDAATKQDDSNPEDKQDVHPTNVNSFEAFDHTNEDNYIYDAMKLQISGIESVDTAPDQVDEGRVENDLKPSAEQTVHQEKEGLFSEMEESNSSSQTLQSEIQFRLDSQPQLNDTGFYPTGNRRKLGSSRKTKRRQHAEDSVTESNQRSTEEVVGNTSDNEPLETKMSLTIETAVQEESIETMLEGMDTLDTAQTEDVSDQVEENAHAGTLVDISEFTTSSIYSSSTADQQLIDQSNSTEMPEEELPHGYSVTEKESEEGKEDTELLRLDGSVQDNYLVKESHLKSEDTESSITLEIETEKSSPEKHTDIECSAFSSSKDKLSSNKEHKDHVNLSQGRGSLHSEDVLNEVQEEVVMPTQMQEMHQIDFSSIKKSDSSLQTLRSVMNAPFDCQPQDNSERTEEQTHAGFNPTGNRRKLGSSRRNKGQQQFKDSATKSHNEPKEEFVENTRGNEALEKTKISAVKTTGQKELTKQTDLDLKPTQEIRKIGSTVNDEENRDKMPEEDTVLSQDVINNSNIVTSTGKDDFVKSNEEETNRTKDPENLNQLTGYDTVQTDLIQSPEDDAVTQNMSYHDSVSTRSVILDALEQGDVNQVQKTKALSCNEDLLEQEINVQQTNDPIKTVRDVRDYNTETGRSMEVFGQDEVVENFEDSTKNDHEVQEMKASQESTHAELFSSNNKTDTSAPIGLEENFRAEPAVDVHEESGISAAVGACNSQKRTEEYTHLDKSENLQGESKQKRRKMGSTRRTRLNRKPEEGMDNKNETNKSELNMQADMKTSDKMEVAGELPMTITSEVSQSENSKLSLNPQYKEKQETNEMSDIDDLTAVLPGQSASHSEDVVNPVAFVQVADIRHSERNVDANMEPSNLDDFKGPEMHITSVLAGRNSNSINPLLSSNTEDVADTGITGGSFVSSCDTTQSAQNDEERLESINVIQDQNLQFAEAPVVAVAYLEIVKSELRGGAGEEHKDAQARTQELNNVNEGVHSKNLEMENASPNRRRKMGSTRRNLRSRSKREDLDQKQEVDNEATEVTTNVGDVKTESLKAKDSDSEKRKEIVEYSHTGDSNCKPPSLQTFEPNPVSHGQLVETELSPNYVPAISSTSPKHDVTSETTPGGRRRKLGSHRKSHGHQSNENQTARWDRITHTENGSDVRSIIDESAIETTEEKSLGLDKISEVDESDKKPSFNISTSKAEEHSRPVSEKTPIQVTPVQHPAETHLGQESQKTFSLAGSSRGPALRSDSYNVMMVGDSSVGKTSFMKRARSGMFSLDLPASVGLDSCMWTVVVDGKPVVLQLWDTAGQERFHSITRQIFHKAQAFLLMYDITSSRSFSAVSYWANCIQEGAAENVTILLLGNKSDCAERQVKTQEGDILAKENNFEFMECSAATGENVAQSLETVARMLSQKVDTRAKTTLLHKEPQQKKSSGCC